MSDEKAVEGLAYVDQRPGPIGTYGVLVVCGQDVSIDERDMDGRAKKINAALKPLADRAGMCERMAPIIRDLLNRGMLVDELGTKELLAAFDALPPVKP